MIRNTTYDELTTGDYITVWRHDGCGQGGRVIEVNDEFIKIVSPADVIFTFPKSDVHHLDEDRPGDPTECLNYNPAECQGPVEMWHSGGMNGRSWPRCTFHGERRQQQYHESSLERYADSDVAPDWFDPADAGERWGDDS